MLSGREKPDPASCARPSAAFRSTGAATRFPFVARVAQTPLVYPTSSAERLTDRILVVMDRKDHWAWPHLTRPGLSREQLTTHFRHEYLTYVRDFPVLLARVLGLGPPAAARVALAENI